MNKKIVFCVCVITFITSKAHAREWIIEIKGSGFIPTSQVFKEIYHSTGAVGAELTTQIWENLFSFFSIDYLQKNGHSFPINTETKVNFLPLAFGLKYLNPFCYGDWYLGLGALAARVHTHDFSPNVIPTYTKWGWGGIIKSGCLFDITHGVFLDVFVNYAFMRAASHDTFNNLVVPHTVKISGVFVGGGLGYRF